MTSNISSFCNDAISTSKEHIEPIPSTSTYDSLTEAQNLKAENSNLFKIDKQNLNKTNIDTIDSMNKAFRDHYHTQMFGSVGAGFIACDNSLSRQQRNNNICQWLQKLNINPENDNRIENSNNFNNLESGASRSMTQSNLSMEVEMSP